MFILPIPLVAMYCKVKIDFFGWILIWIRIRVRWNFFMQNKSNDSSTKMDYVLISFHSNEIFGSECIIYAFLCTRQYLSENCQIKYLEKYTDDSQTERFGCLRRISFEAQKGEQTSDTAEKTMFVLCWLKLDEFAFFVTLYILFSFIHLHSAFRFQFFSSYNRILLLESFPTRRKYYLQSIWRAPTSKTLI